MKLWNFDANVMRNLDAGGAAGGAAGSGGGDGAAGNQQQQQQGGNQQQPPTNMADAAARAAAAGGDQQQQQQQQGDGAANKPYLPDGLAETYRGANDKETIDKLAADIANRAKPPAKATDYKFEAPPEFTEKFGDMKDDPVLPLWAEIAHGLGLDNKQFSSVVPMLYEKMEKAGLIDKPVDYHAEMMKLAPKDGDMKNRVRAAAERVNGITTTVKALETRGVVSKQDALVLGAMTASPEAVMAFEKVLALIPKEHGPQGGGNGAGEQVSEHTKQMRALYPTMITK